MKLKSKRQSCMAEWMTRNNVRTSPKLPFYLGWCRLGDVCLSSMEKKKMKLFAWLGCDSDWGTLRWCRLRK